MNRRSFLIRTGGALVGTGLLTGAAARPVRGPLVVSRRNRRYFATPDGSEVLLTGAHTWNNLVDMGRSDPPEAFDFPAYLDFLERHGHNVIRLWTWDSTTWDTRANGRWGKDFVHHAAPLPWLRTGPGRARDGKPRFDLKRFDPAYFDRLRARVRAAGERGIYVSVMLFEGWGLMHGNRRRGATPDWAWHTHPFHPDNNANGIDAGGRPHSRAHPEVNALQAAYIRKVVDTVGDRDNVLYEVINEGGEDAWDRWVVATLRACERDRPRQHPIGLTGHGAQDLKAMLAGGADWVSPGRRDGFGDDPPAWDGAAVSLLDTDHVWGIGGNAGWVWKAFTRGHNPLFMDPYDGSVLAERFDPRWEPLRRNLGFVRRLTADLDLGAVTPQGDLASSGFCLAEPGRTYVVFAPGGHVTVDLRAARGPLRAAWIDPATGRAHAGSGPTGGSQNELSAPFDGDAVLHLRRA